MTPATDIIGAVCTMHCRDNVETRGNTDMQG
eukprot:CAMPEP_0174306356 /NCGR_PEP_ID=MMETSP0810-20121108/395_1 /TAXON_ID=73025 ORGANISM="Eutreptiella gymnastica-like, Strain CCMP1594" /NCGR_SAMPLE_ID=MMETSP0810 /ASSEMBLY_ACC=CAM_ASM_000659 /LENGTH=30 /DNA_ID= /DNA_START= /DNA_END= /DNA_ORIENTATION=